MVDDESVFGFPDTEDEDEDDELNLGTMEEQAQRQGIIRLPNAHAVHLHLDTTNLGALAQYAGRCPCPVCGVDFEPRGDTTAFEAVASHLFAKANLGCAAHRAAMSTLVHSELDGTVSCPGCSDTFANSPLAWAHLTSAAGVEHNWLRAMARTVSGPLPTMALGALTDPGLSEADRSLSLCAKDSDLNGTHTTFWHM